MARVKDGPNCEKKYSKARPKILHLLKQPTKDNPSLPELVQQIVREGTIGRKMMYHIAQRSYGILNGFISWETACKKNDALLGEALLQSAIVNLENVRTAKKTTRTLVNKWAEKNFERWHGQINEWKPQVVLCGGTFDAVHKAFHKVKRVDVEIKHASTGMSYFYDPDPKIRDCVYLEIVHPSAWNPPVCKVYTRLMASAKEILKKANRR